jgi:hypothetical protein
MTKKIKVSQSDLNVVLDWLAELDTAPVHGARHGTVLSSIPEVWFV